MSHMNDGDTVPTVIDLIMEIADRKAPPLILKIGLMFKPVQITPTSIGYAPTVIYAKDMISQAELDRHQVTTLVSSKDLRRSLDALVWSLDNDPDADPEFRAYVKEVYA